MSKLKAFIYGVSVLSGTIIGVGLFSLPYITARVGFCVMLFYFLVLGVVVILVHSFFGELALNTPDKKRLPGFARIYLGEWGEKIAYISTILGIFGSLLAYLIVGGEFLTDILLPVLGGNNLIYTLIYFFGGAALIYFGIHIIAKVEFWGLVLFLAVLTFFFFYSRPYLRVGYLFPSPDFRYLFLPYGAILFSLWGVDMIPELEEMLGKNKDLLKKIIPVAILISILTYIVFVYLILGITGQYTSESALAGLKIFFGNGFVNLLLFLGVITTFTSFITLGLVLKNMFGYDLKMKKNSAFLITCGIPLAIFLLGIKSFIPLISFLGGIMLGIDGILILLMYRKLKLKTQGQPCGESRISSASAKIKILLVYPLMLMLALGIVYEIRYFIK